MERHEAEAQARLARMRQRSEPPAEPSAAEP